MSFNIIANTVKQSPNKPEDCFGTKRLAMTPNRDLLKLAYRTNMASLEPNNGFPHPNRLQPIKKDVLIALVITLIALAAYVRTLAPDILYGDSAEFQCLAYTLGVTHSTGYPTYLFLARLLGFLPINNPAWRISLLSAICASFTVGGVYWMARYFTRNRIGPALGALALGLSYTFWSQAVITEVYTPGMAFIVAIMILLFHWQIEPHLRKHSLFMAALLAGIGFGVHASVWLIAPPAVGFVLWRLWRVPASRAEWGRSLLSAGAGVVLGLLIFLVAFTISDRLNSPTSFIRTTLEPSRLFWNLEPEDFNSTFKHLKMTVISAQWGNALFPGGDFSFHFELSQFVERLLNLEFSAPLLLMVLVGWVGMLQAYPAGGIYYGAYFGFALFLILNYQVGDKYVFYLSLYIPLTIALGVGIGLTLEWLSKILKPLPTRSYWMLSSLPVLFFVTMVAQPSLGLRWQALKDGAATFVTEDYAYPVNHLAEPRLVAKRRLAGIADNAVFVLDWRALFTTAYLAHVERGLTNALFFEAMPYGNQGEVAPTLIQQLNDYLNEDRPVYTDQRYPGLENNFRLFPGPGDLYKLSLRQ